ncbi:peptidoglycan -binding protein [Plastorhodobacter daqingensis]|uniref:Peptidoglycan -binding protein n=1 Tax=Plastorhodobacter daqingensis TaxID=1387281 RepID=A0ABW2UQQ2_9RHOB
MALMRRSGQRFAGSIWPGFVDAMTALLLVLMFVLSIFMIVQFVLRETITNQGSELDSLSLQLAGLADALGMERQEAERLRGVISESEARVTAFEAQVAALLAERDAALDEQTALRTLLAQTRDELDAEAEAARLAAAQREAIEAMLAEMRDRAEGLEEQLSEQEAARLAESAAAAALRTRLENAEAELTAMTLALEQQRREAEETLTLLAAAQAARRDAEQLAERQLSEAERQAALLAIANETLAAEQAQSTESQRRLAVLNEQIVALRAQLSGLQGLLDAAAERDTAAQVQIESLGSQLNTALAQVAVEQRRRAELEEAERRRLEEEARQLERFRSDFFGKLRDVLDGREGVRVVGDRFVFSSEVLFELGSANMAAEGRAQIARVVDILTEIADDIPPEIDWIIRVDGHTDNLPLSGIGEFRDNWELSQARALSVVRYMTEALGFPPERLAATGFGEYRPVNPGNTPDARAQNRRIELKLTER